MYLMTLLTARRNAGKVLTSVTVKASAASSSTLDAILDDKLPANLAPDYTHTLVSNPDGSVDLGLKDDEGAIHNPTDKNR